MRAVGKSRVHAGFTLIELLMVVVIIGVLMGILMPVVNGMKQNALKRQREAEARLIESAIRNYHAENGKWPGPVSEYYHIYPDPIDKDAQAKLINNLSCAPITKLSLLDTNNMNMDVTGTFYIQPGTTNPWVITISNRTVTVQ